MEVRLDGGHETGVDGVEGWVGQWNVAGRTSGAHAIQLSEDADTTTDVGGVIYTATDTHPTVLGATNDYHLVVRWTRYAERL